MAGLIVNRFRGDPAILAPGLAPLAALARVPVLGVVPYRRDIHIDEEDSQDLRSTRGAVDVCVLQLPTVSNFTDFGALARQEGVGVRYERDPERVGTPDLLVLPGSRDTEADLRWLRARGLDRVVLALAPRVPVLGLCGGYQMLGARMGDAAGLGLLPSVTNYSEQKIVRPAAGTTTGRWLLPAGLSIAGYEIHLGRTSGGLPLVGDDGAVSDLVAGTYFHGLLDTPAVCVALVGALRGRRGLDPAPPSAQLDQLAHFDAAADLIEAHVDLGGLL